MALESPLILLVYFQRCLYLGPCLLASQPRGFRSGLAEKTLVLRNSISAPGIPFRAMTAAVVLSHSVRMRLKPTGFRENLSRKDLREKLVESGPGLYSVRSFSTSTGPDCSRTKTERRW